MIHVYTGNGKGKTTAALGLALRARGAGLKVYIGQFCKGREHSELKLLRKIKGIKIEQFGRSCFIRKKTLNLDRELAQRGWEKIKKIIQAKEYDMIILDEINICFYYNLLQVKKTKDILKSASKDTEIILTGRYAPREIVEIADLVSEIKELKHYFNKGAKARKGIEF